MAKTPREIARVLRAFRNAHRLGLLRHVCIVPGTNACEATLAQKKQKYAGNAVPRLPLPDCRSADCRCDYLPVGSGKLHNLDANVPPRRMN